MTLRTESACRVQRRHGPGARRILHWLLLAMTLALCGMPARAADVNHGNAIYAGVCAACHGPNPLNNNYYVMNGANNAATIQYYINYAYPMQPLSNLSAADVADVAAYLGSLTSSAPVAPQSGYWWNQFEGGRGFTIEQNSASGNVYFSAYLYAGNGNPVWYAAGPAPMAGSTFSAPLTAYATGQTLTGAFKPATQGASPGNVSITFGDSSHGSLTWPGGTIPIQRYEFTPGGLFSPPTESQPQTGYWWNPAEGGRGYAIEVQYNIAYVAAFMYDPSGNPVWYASGPATLSGSVYMGTWASYSGGQTLAGDYQAPAASAAAGNLTVQFASATSGTLTLPDGRQIPTQRYGF